MTAPAGPTTARHARFRHRTSESLLAEAALLGLDLPFDDEVGVLLEGQPVGPYRAPNRVAIHPMEGCDSLPDGAPGERTIARYRGFAEGGNGLIWAEAASVVPGGRSNAGQLMLTRETAGAFRTLVEATRKAAASGAGAQPVLVLQLTHSGRFSHTPGASRRVACANPHLDRPGERVEAWRDEELDELAGRFVTAAELAREAGFDLVDIKACHGYLVHELMGAHLRQDSRYGGTFENRTRFLLDVVRRVTARGIPVAVRLNAADLLPWPYGFGCSEASGAGIDLAEPRRVARLLREAGCLLLNVSAGIPAFRPHVGRPYDRAAGGGPLPNEHPLAGVVRLIDLAAQIQRAVPDLPVVGTGYSWLRQFWPHVGAGVVRRGGAEFIGLGRAAFAYPDAARDLARSGRLDPSKCCVACSHCTELMRARTPTGCVVRHRRSAIGHRPSAIGHRPSGTDDRPSTTVDRPAAIDVRRLLRTNTLVIGSGAAALKAAVTLHALGQTDVVIVTESWGGGTSANAGSDKQTYYKLALSGESGDSARQMAEDLAAGGMHGDVALAEASHSAQAFYDLVALGVPFPHDTFGGFPGYRTDHDRRGRGTSAGPLTSRLMVEALGRDVRRRGIRVLDRHSIAALLLDGSTGRPRIAGAVALAPAEGDSREAAFVLINARSVVLATGGPGDMYADSVYPVGQKGSIGLALAIGATAQNLTESQFGLASTAFRWNVSGSYQQVVPRYVSTDAGGGDEREFLEEAFPDPGALGSAIFRKGYQWPFDPRRVAGFGSSAIDLLVYRERVTRGRRVFLDFRHNPGGPHGRFSLGLLQREARDYLERSGATGATPIERLRQLNQPAIDLYRSHGIDLAGDRLEIAVCAQHNNGGLAANHWWESNVEGLFPIGEVNGSHGVFRPGGAALNAGQVGALRAAMYIARRRRSEPVPDAEFLAATGQQVAAVTEYARRSIARGESQEPSAAEALREIQERMSAAGAILRGATEVSAAVRGAWALVGRLREEPPAARVAADLAEVFHVRGVALAHAAYLEAIDEYLAKGGQSRGSYLVLQAPGMPGGPSVGERWRFLLNEPGAFVDRHVLEVRLEAESRACKTWVPLRPIPDTDTWFENVWKAYRNDEVIR